MRKLTVQWEKYLPDIINEFGILVQKPYAGEYSLNRQKAELTKYFNKEASALNNALNLYVPVNTKSPNAYDASVMKALNTFLDTMSTLDRATVQMTLEEAQSKSLGEYYNGFVSEDDMSLPLAYSNIAKDYLMTNIKRYKATYEKSIKSKDVTDNLDKANTKEVARLLPQIVD